MNSRITVGILVMVIVLCVGAGAWWYFKKDSALSNLKATQNKTQNSTVGSNEKTYTNAQYGFTFQYDSSQIYISQTGSTIYTHDISDPVGTDWGNSIEIFSKNNSDSLEQAIKKTVLTNFPSNYCQVVAMDNTTYESKTYLTAMLFDQNPAIPSDPGSVDPENSCNNSYVTNGNVEYFMYNPSYPSKFIFWRGGAAISDQSVLETLTFTNNGN